jgi:mRNA interferase RelE/StbE
VNYTSSAKKDLMKLPPDVQDRIRHAIEELLENPHHRGVEKLTTSSKSQEYRIKVGKYRVKFLIHDKILTIFVIRFGLRENIYN